MHRILSLFTFMMAAICLTACGTQSVFSLPHALQPYQVDIAQGNFVSSEQVAALRAGMPQAQVRNILGTPLLTDIFHADRWDYVFTIQSYGVKSKPRILTVYFKSKMLDHWEGDTMPSEVEFAKSLQSGRKMGQIPPLVATDKELADFAAANNPKSTSSTTIAADSSAAVSNKVYPSLE